MIPIADEEKKVTEEKEELSPENTEAEAAAETAEETPLVHSEISLRSV